MPNARESNDDAGLHYTTIRTAWKTADDLASETPYDLNLHKTRRVISKSWLRDFQWSGNALVDSKKRHADNSNKLILECNIAKPNS